MQWKHGVIYSKMYLRLFIFRQDSEYAEHTPESWEVETPDKTASSSPSVTLKPICIKKEMQGGGRGVIKRTAWSVSPQFPKSENKWKKHIWNTYENMESEHHVVKNFLLV